MLIPASDARQGGDEERSVMCECALLSWRLNRSGLELYLAFVEAAKRSCESSGEEKMPNLVQRRSLVSDLMPARNEK